MVTLSLEIHCKYDSEIFQINTFFKISPQKKKKKKYQEMILQNYILPPTEKTFVPISWDDMGKLFSLLIQARDF